MSPSTRAADTKQRSDAWGRALLSITVIAVLVMGVLFLYFRSTQEEFDKVSLCPARGVLGREVILIDSTDVLSTAQREDLRNKLREIRIQLPESHELSIYTVDEIESKLLEPVVRLCNPGTGSDHLGVWSNPKRIRQRWERSFVQPIEDTFQRVTEAQFATPRSPIMESIQSVAISGFGSGSRDIPRRLTIVSDMLQNTQGFSHYRSFPEFAQFRATDYYKRVKPDLRGVMVSILFIRRDGVVPSGKLIDFWRSYLHDAGAILDLVQAVQG